MDGTRDRVPLRCVDHAASSAHASPAHAASARGVLCLPHLMALVMSRRADPAGGSSNLPFLDPCPYDACGPCLYYALVRILLQARLYVTMHGLVARVVWSTPLVSSPAWLRVCTL